MHDIFSALHRSLNEGRRLTGLQAWSHALETDLRTVPTAISGSEIPEPVSLFLDRNLSLAAELFLSTPEHPRPCPLLEVFRNQAVEQSTIMGQDGLVQKLVGTFEEVFTHGQVQASGSSLLGQIRNLTKWTLRGLELRCATLQLAWRAMGESREPSTLKRCFEQLISAYQGYFSTECWREIPGSCDYRCAGFHRLSEIASKQGVHREGNAAAAIVSTIDGSRFASSHRDPAVAFVCDTLAIAFGFSCGNAESLGQDWKPGDTWVLLGAKDSVASSGTGMVLRLRAEKVTPSRSRMHAPATCPGVFYPDPLMNAHSPIDEDFQLGLRNAWMTLMYSRNVIGSSHDFRWHVAAIDRSEYHLQRRILGSAGLKGDSGTLAFAAALRSCDEGKPLRQDTACTAALEIDFQFKLSPPSIHCSNPRLLPVELVADKAHAVACGTTLPTSRIDVWSYGQPALANKIRRILVAPNQSLEFLPEIKTIPVSEWDIAWRELNDFELLLADFSENAAARWNQIGSARETPHPSDFVDRRLNDIHRFDLYVSPELEWEDLNPNRSHQGEREHQRWVSTKLESPRADQVKEALRYGIEKSTGVVLLDGAGVGKTVTSFKMQQLLSDPITRTSLFGDSLPRMVFHWSRKLPCLPTEVEPLASLLSADPMLLQVLSKWTKGEEAESGNSSRAEGLVQYALAEKRVVVIVDAFDELDGEQRSIIKRAFKESLKTKGIFWIFTGRDYAINEESGRGGIFQLGSFRRLRICPFSQELQDQYMVQALPGVPWRESLSDTDEDWDELLGVPHTLREIVRIFQLSSAPKQLPTFESPSDLFLQCSDKMLERELEDKERPPLVIAGEALALGTRIHILERALGAIALEMAFRSQWKELSVAPRDLEQSINRIMKASKERFCKSFEADDYEYDVEECWKWAKRILNQFELMNGANQADIGTRVLSFSTRRVQEMRVARNLSTFATEEDLRSAPENSSALAHNGDEAWENIWKSTMKMPLSKIDITRYCSALQVLFERPIRTDQRRPTELMWLADRWIRRDPELWKLRERFREKLGLQFKDEYDEVMRSGAEMKRQSVKELLNASSYVLLSDPENKVDDHDVGRFNMGEPGETVPVQLSPYGICKWTLSNAQFQLFDDNFVGADLWEGFVPERVSELDRLKEFAREEQPAIFLSWYDSYWFVEYMNSGARCLGRMIEHGGRTWKFIVPSEAQFEYAARAGGSGRFFRNEEGEEVSTEILGTYAHFGQNDKMGRTIGVKEKSPNAWGLYQCSGNVWKWVYDQWIVKLPGGLDPLITSERLRNMDRVSRGGGWNHDAILCDSMVHHGLDPSDRWVDSGMVLALSPTKF